MMPARRESNRNPCTCVTRNVIELIGMPRANSCNNICLYSEP